MSLSRALTTIIGLPLVALVLLKGNNLIISILMMIATFRCLYEYKDCAKSKYKIISWVGYILAIYLAAMPYIPAYITEMLNIVGIPAIIMILFMHSIFTDMKITFSDVAFSLFGILYFVLFTSFIPRIYSMEFGKILIWYIMIISWGSDILAYLIGRNFGKHKFSKVSPNKTIEGCTAGVIGAIIFSLIYTYFINTYSDIYVNYIVIGWVAAVLCIIGQLGDFAASVIKRHLEVKDYSNIFPGHGGMVDRLDSVIAIAPFAYILFMILV